VSKEGCQQGTWWSTVRGRGVRGDCDGLLWVRRVVRRDGGGLL
jgi:hypothetical protein